VYEGRVLNRAPRDRLGDGESDSYVVRRLQQSTDLVSSTLSHGGPASLFLESSQNPTAKLARVWRRLGERRAHVRIEKELQQGWLRAYQGLSASLRLARRNDLQLALFAPQRRGRIVEFARARRKRASSSWLPPVRLFRLCSTTVQQDSSLLRDPSVHQQPALLGKQVGDVPPSSSGPRRRRSSSTLHYEKHEC
jgi:hypothetical protein